MAKMTREKLKGIVKECLVEILSEGLNGKSIVEKSSMKKQERKPQKRKD